MQLVKVLCMYPSVHESCHSYISLGRTMSEKSERAEKRGLHVSTK